MVDLTTAIVPDVIVLLVIEDQPRTRYAAVDLANALFSMATRKEAQNTLHSPVMSSRPHFSLEMLPQS